MSTYEFPTSTNFALCKYTVKQFEVGCNTATNMSGVPLAEFFEDLETALAQHGTQEGSAPLIRNVFIPVRENWQVTNDFVPVAGNEDIVKFAYNERNREELAVLEVSIDKEKYLERNGGIMPRAKFVHAECYMRQKQIDDADTPEKKHKYESATQSLFIISIRGLSECTPRPIAPITMLRNAAGPAFGGNGTPIDKAAYAKAVKFWSTYLPAR